MLRVYDELSGVGGTSHGWSLVPGVEIAAAATPLRGGGDHERARAVTDPLSTVTASGNHHGMALPPLITRQNSGHPQSRTTSAVEPVRTVTANGRQSVVFAPPAEQLLLVPYYGTATSAKPATEPVGTLPTRDRYALAHTDLAAAGIELDDVRFRMLEPHEIAAAMAFGSDYRTAATSKRAKVRLWGNAVTPPVAELIGSALVECITGEELPRHHTPTASGQEQR